MKTISLFVFSLCFTLATHGKTLTEALREKAKAASTHTPKEKKAIMEKALLDLRKSKIEEQALKKGAQLPDFTLPNASGELIRLSVLLKTGPVILTFYRGSWCPYCNLQLQFYQRYLDQFKKAGAELVAITPEKPDLSLKMVKEQNLGYQVLTDANNEYAKKLGLAFKLSNDLKKLYLEFGLDLEKSQGNKEWELPLPATYVVKGDRRVIYSFIDADYKKRADPEDILKALKK